LNGLYFDAAYIAKCYLHEPDGPGVREAARSSPAVYTSAFALAEVTCTFHRHLREGTLTQATAAQVHEQFLEDIRAETWILLPITERVLRQVETRVRTLPRNFFLRAGDAIHIVSALDAGFDEIWTNDHHLLAAAAHFGLKGHTVRSGSNW
jgi:predicted nucleic acid-binding protein